MTSSALPHSARPGRPSPWQVQVTRALALGLLLGTGALAHAQAPSAAPADAPKTPAAPAGSTASAATGTAQPSARTQAADGTEAAAIENQILEAPKDLALAQPLRLLLTVRHPAQSRVQLGLVPTTSRFHLLGSATLPPEPKPEGAPPSPTTRTTLEVRLAALRPGTWSLPPLSVKVVDPTGQTTELATTTESVTVRALMADDPAPSLKPMAPGVPVWVEDWTVVWAGAALVGLGGLGVAAALWRRKQRPKAPEILRPPHEVALERLHALARAGLLERGDYMLYYVRLSEAVREYLGQTYGFPGLELTTGELALRLEAQSLPAGLSREEVRQWMEHCDIVKFSEFVPARADAEKALRQAFAIVELTHRAQTPEAPAPSDGQPQGEHATNGQADGDAPEIASPAAPTRAPALMASVRKAGAPPLNHPDARWAPADLLAPLPSPNPEASSSAEEIAGEIAGEIREAPQASTSEAEDKRDGGMP